MSRLDRATSSFCAVKVIREELEKNGYKEFLEEDDWTVKPGSKFFIEKNNSAIFAFHIGSESPVEKGFRIISSHSDSPCFKLKPDPELITERGVVFLNVEKYGGGIMYTWFDRPLSMSGRVSLKTDDPFRPSHRIFDLRRPVATIPHLAIHFNRQVNEGNHLSVQKDMNPVLGRFTSDFIMKEMKKGGIVKNMIARHLEVDPDDIVAMEVSLYPCEKAVRIGYDGEFLQSGRIDDLSMAMTSLEALVNSDNEHGTSVATKVMAVFDNEETGSSTKQGAHSPVLKNAFMRICNQLCPGDSQAFFRAVSRSFMISADDAHAFHPSYSGKHDRINHPVINGGPVVKINANSKYMTDSHGSAVFSELCRRAGVDCQYFVNHGDVPGGSTLGNILTAQLDIKGVDMGCPIWAMHSAAETAGVKDHVDTEKVFRLFFA